LLAAITKLVAIPQVSWGENGLQLKPPQSGWLVPAQDFAKAIQNYKILPPLLSRLLVVTMPWIEIAAALALFTRRFRYEGTLVLTGLMVVFLIAIVRALVAGLDIGCGCFSVSPNAKQIGLQNLLLDGSLLAMACVMIFLMERKRKMAAASAAVS
jgi:hypothetical protein